MKIAVFSSSFPRFYGDDAGVFVKRMVEAFSTIGLSGVVFVPRDRDESEGSVGAFNVCRFKYTIVTRGRLAFGAGIMPNIRAAPLCAVQAPGLLAGFFIAAFRNRDSFDIVHANWLITAIPAMVFAWCYGTPYVVTTRGEDLRLLRSLFFRVLLKIPLKRASKIVTVGKSVGIDLGQYYPTLQNRIVTIENGVTSTKPTSDELNAFRESRGLTAGIECLVFVGSVIPRKQIEVLIEALSKVSGSDVALLICGRLDDTSYVQTLRELVTRLELGSRVRFEGAVHSSDVPLYLGAAIGYVSASSFEGRSNSVLEAMASGLPVLLSDIPAHREMVRPGESGLLFRNDNEAARAIESILASPHLRSTLGSAALEDVRGQSWEESARRYQALFSEVLGRESTSVQPGELKPDTDGK